MAQPPPRKKFAASPRQSPEEITEERITKAIREGATLLDLRGLGLTTLPSSMGRLQNLRSLDLNGNLLRELPASFGQLQQLEVLYVSGNQLRKLPTAIGQLQRLRALHLAGNQLRKLPTSLGQLKQLRDLYLNDNQLRELPSSLSQLTQLQTLWVQNNQLESLPASLGQLQKLQSLHVQGNQLEFLPTSLGQLPHLRELVLGDGAVLGLPREVTKHASPAEILSYYIAQRQRSDASGTQPLNEAKVLVLGEAAVGKSSLILALTEGKLKQALGKTHGIIQKKWEVPIRENHSADDASAHDNEHLRLNLWDFGGQEIYHATHAFFLTSRAVYLVVADARVNDHQNNLEYWLQMATSFGGGAPIWIAVNKTDEHGDGPDEHALRRKFPLLRGLLRTSCWTGEGIEALKRGLVTEALGLKGVREPMNNIWLGIKAALEDTEEDTIPLDTYLQLCRDRGEDDVKMQLQLLDIWDKLGTVRYFPTRAEDPPELRETAILNPEWVTKAVYAVLDDAAIRKAGGLMQEADLVRIMDGCGYAPGRHQMIEHVMRRFDLLYDAPERKPRRMLVPQLLPEHQPKLDFSPEGTLRFLYRYPVLPAALVPTFIARIHRRLSRAPGPWRHGLVLEFKDGQWTEKVCRVLVIGDPAAKQVEITVQGPAMAAREALDAVRFTFEGIHGAIQDLAVEELIPVPGRPEAPLLRYRHLRALEWNGKTHFPAEGRTPEEIITVEVREVLSGVRGAQKAAADRKARSVIYVQPGGRMQIGDGAMSDITNKMNISGGTFNGPVGVNQSFPNCYNTAQGVAEPELKEKLTAMIAEVEKMYPELEAGEKIKAERKLKTLTEEAATSEPDKEQLALSSKGLIEAAKTCAKMAGPVVSAVKAVVGLFGVALP